MKPWPYPRWIAHRGAGLLAPENTLAAFRCGYAQGYRMFECDVRLSADEQPFLLHDDHLDRTTTGCGPACALNWAELAKLDAGCWHGADFAGEGLPGLQAVLAFCQQHGCALNIELKPDAGRAARTGEVVARLLQREWRQAPPPLLSSFQFEALESARAAAPQWPRALLFEHLPADWLLRARALDCVAIVAQSRQWTAASVDAARAAGFRLAAYTVNAADEAQRLLALGVDALITDRVDAFDPGGLAD